MLVCCLKREGLSGKRNLRDVGWCHVEEPTHAMRWSDLAKTKRREIMLY